MSPESNALLNEVLQTPSDSLRQGAMGNAGIKEHLQTEAEKDNYKFFAHLKQHGKLIAVVIMWVLVITFFALLIGWVLYLYNCPYVSSESGRHIESIVFNVFSWVFGGICHYGFDKFKKAN